MIPILHFIEQGPMKEGELPTTVVKQAWPKPVKMSSWHLAQDSKDFPTLEDADENLSEGLTSVKVVGGKLWAKVALVNKVLLEDGTEDSAARWINVFRDADQAESHLSKSRQKKKTPEKRLKLPWVEPGAEVA